jgi:hypothetical protein
MGGQLLHRASRWGTPMLALALLVGCAENEVPDDALQSIHAPEVARIVPAKEALAGAHIPTVDPATMHEAEIRKALESGPRCDFRYTTRGNPVLAFTLQRNGEAHAGVVKLNGHLVVLQAASSTGAVDGNGEFLLRADPVQMAVIPDAEKQVIERRNVRREEANALFKVGERLRVGYRGYLDCASEPPTISPREASGR